jgi:hypothetical protein
MSAILNLGDKITAGNRADATFFYKKRVADDSGTLLTEAETDANNRELLAQSLFDKASVVYTAGGVKASKAYSVKGTDFTVTRAGVKNVVNRAGVLTEIPANTPATEFANGVLKGTLIEPARTNSIRNNTMQGAVVGVVGSGGERPTNYQVETRGLTVEVLEFGAVNGIESIVFRFSGTASSTGDVFILPELVNQIVASSGQVWTSSFYLQLITSPQAPNSSRILVEERNASSSLLTTTTTTVNLDSMLSRYSSTRTLNQATTAFVTTKASFPVTPGQSYDFTIRIGLPQMEQSAVATSVIKTTDTAITQPADVITATGVSGLTNGQGTVLIAFTPLNLPATTYHRLFAVDNGTSSDNGYDIGYGDAGGALARTTFRIGGATSFDSTAGAVTIGQRQIVAFAFANNDFQVALNGTLQGASASGSTNIQHSRIIIGGRSDGTGNNAIEEVYYFPTRLTNAELETLTTL